MFVPSVIMSYFPGILTSREMIEIIKLFPFSDKKYSHDSPWPAFTETFHKDSVSKVQEKPGALKVS